jgi:hypothetical protein
MELYIELWFVMHVMNMLDLLMLTGLVIGKPELIHFMFETDWKQVCSLIDTLGSVFAPENMYLS